MRRKLTVLGVVAFVLVDIVLVYLAMRHVSGDDARAQGDGAAALPTVEASPAKNEKNKGGGGKKHKKAKNDEGRFADLPNGPKGVVLLSISDDGTVVRGVRGSCEGRGDTLVGISSDSGATFEEVTPDLTSVLRVSAISDSEVQVIGTNDDCEARSFVSDDLGKSWDESSAADDWYFSPDSDTKVHGPSDTSDTGCEPASVSVVDEAVARVGCADGEIRGTDNGGEEWVTLGSLEGLGAVTFDGPGDAYALASTGECGAQVATSTNGGSAWDDAGCIDGDDPQGITASDRVVLAQVNGQVFRSVDDGQSWEKA